MNPSLVLSTLNLPFDSLTSWIRREMRHEALLMAEFNRIQHFNNGESDQLVQRRLVNMNHLNGDAGPNNTMGGVPSFIFNPDRDAMFKVGVSLKSYLPLHPFSL